MSIFLICSILCLVRVTRSNMSGFIVGGRTYKIHECPHVALYRTECHYKGGVKYNTCGGSILNQRIILTACHCLEDCMSGTIFFISVGQESRDADVTHLAVTFVKHSDYNPYTLQNDIAMIRTAHRITLGRNVKRVIIMKNPPMTRDSDTYLAGWGAIDEETKEKPKYIRGALQKILSHSECDDMLDENLIPGTLCAVPTGRDKDYGYGAKGDSGSALIARGFLQLGLVSYKTQENPYLIVYTNVSYFYDWIVCLSKKIYCT